MNRNTTSGSAAVLSLTTVLILLVVSLGVTTLSIGTLRRSDRDSTAFLAQQAAMAGLELQITRATVESKATRGLFTSAKANLTADLSLTNPGANIVAEVSPRYDKRFAWVTSTATVENHTRSVRALVLSKRHSIWDNAIFAGGGASGKAINGNVDIRGSVHILGEGEFYRDLNGNGMWDSGETFTDKNRNGVWDPGEKFTDVNGDGVCNVAEPFDDANGNGAYDGPLTQASINSGFGGDAFVGNNYYGMDSTVRGVIDNPPMEDGVETLHAEFRVKRGKVELSGSGQIGEPTNPDPSMKGTVDGVFVSDGFTGSSGANAVFSDNGTSNSYDLEAADIEFPLISGPNAKPYTDGSGKTWVNHAAYLDANSMSVSVSTFTAATAAFAQGPDSLGNEIRWQPPTKTQPAYLYVKGLVSFSGDLKLGSGSETLRFSGRGTLYSRGSIAVDCNFYPTDAGRFPSTAAVGLIASEDVTLGGTGGGHWLTGAIYAQNTARCTMQYNLVGSLVSKYYDLGSQVPNIFQVPSLSDSMPPGMPGDFTYSITKVLSWRNRVIRPTS